MDFSVFDLWNVFCKAGKWGKIKYGGGLETFLQEMTLLLKLLLKHSRIFNSAVYFLLLKKVGFEKQVNDLKIWEISLNLAVFPVFHFLRTLSWSTKSP